VKLLFDENLSPALVRLLADLFPDSRHVHECGLGSTEDSAIWEYAILEGYAVVSKDIDFSERAVGEKRPSKVIWLRIGNASVIETEALIRRNAILIQHFSQREGDTLLVLQNPRRN
jgi:predicted nuclease of predicted toxin-antitoxin system